MFEPKNVADIPQIQEIIQKEIDEIIKNGLTDQEYTRALKQALHAIIIICLKA